MITDEVIFKLAKNFNRLFDDFEGIYLFGDNIEGRPDEDIELAAIFKIEDKSKRGQIWPVVGKIETETGACIDLYPYTKESFKQDEEIYNRVMEKHVFYNKRGERSSSANQ